MKTKLRILQGLLIMLLWGGAMGVQAQVGTLTQTGSTSVCLNSTKSYGVMPTDGSTYTWAIKAGTGGAGTIHVGVAPNNLITIDWTSIGTCLIKVTELNATGCSAVIDSIEIIVLPLPITLNQTATVCSGLAIGVNLPATSTNSLAITSYDITAVVALGLTGTPTAGTGLTGTGVIAADAFTNTTGGDLTVVYTVIPYAGTCAGAAVTVTVTINPAPMVSPMIATVCSGSVIGVNLPTSSSNGLTIDKWDISASVAGSLGGAATIGDGITLADAIAGDIFTNTTSSPLNVVYTVTPYVGTCVGSSFTITVTINPAPTVTAMISAACSGSAIAVNLPTSSSNSLTIDKWDVSASVAVGLTGSPTIGTGLTNANSIAGDTYTNTTGLPLNVAYTVIPYVGTCVGASFTITVAINPAPTVDPVTAVVCSGSIIGVNLPTSSSNSMTIDKWDVTAVVPGALSGTATIGIDITNSSAIAGDIFTNTTSAPLDVVYTVTPYVGACVGASFTITVTINPAPTVANMTDNSCSGVIIGTILPATSANSLALTTYDISANVAAGLTGAATMGNGLTDVNAIANDVFANPTTGSLDVVYTVTPYVGTCKGANFTITVTIYPAVSASPIYHD